MDKAKSEYITSLLSFQQEPNDLDNIHILLPCYADYLNHIQEIKKVKKVYKKCKKAFLKAIADPNDYDLEGVGVCDKIFLDILFVLAEYRKQCLKAQGA